ncbi:serine/threonine dehydratase [Modestobacter italicus]|uniref:serine/threonine dehydratase n=1 Tax=Modestobacter italicus (strain DSM 44449 / CECT 9708 / BC 501) TaxID=2732864 RepID=UPI0027E18451|nr:serine/threonine dehydratase [Modestobacter italicus]
MTAQEDPDQALPAPVTRDEVAAAGRRIAGRVRRTPTVEWAVPLPGGPVPVVLKLEFLQHTGSFKARGALNRLLAAPRLPDLVVTASGGNHGLAVAHAARQLGLPAEVYVPETAPAVKVAGIRALGATAVLAGSSYAEAAAASRERSQAPGALAVHAYDDRDVVAGQGTVAEELDAQVPGLDTVLVATGGGGLIGGIAAWYGDTARVVSVETHGTAALSAALTAGRPVDVEVGGLASDALGARRVGGHGFSTALATGVRAVLVDEDAVRAARRLLWQELHVAAEPGGATALAGLLAGAYVPAAGERVGVVVCGANADPADLTG